LGIALDLRRRLSDDRVYGELRADVFGGLCDLRRAKHVLDLHGRIRSVALGWLCRNLRRTEHLLDLHGELRAVVQHLYHLHLV
jgi:hypothetical protein